LKTHLELGHRHKVFDAQLEQVEHAPVKGPRERQAVRPLLRRLREEEGRGVVLLRQEGKRIRLLERPQLVLLVEGDGVRALQRGLYIPVQ
jgi:hypothetical protein